MYSVEISWSGLLKVLSPLHVGSGDTRGGGDPDDPEIAELLRDGLGRPVIPGATLKGALRDMLERSGAAGAVENAKALFGEIKDEGTGSAGVLTIYDAPMLSAPDGIEALTGADKAQGEGVFLAARTAIDQASGVADDGKLFHQEMVAPGALFRLRFVLRLTSTRAGDEGELRGLVESLLAGMKTEWALGKGKTGGHGGVALDDASLKSQRRAASALAWQSLDQASGNASPVARRKPLASHEIALVCDGPFLIRDGFYASDGDRKAKEKIQVRTQRISNTQPLVLGASIRGALRNRLAWIAACRALARGVTETEAQQAGRAAAGRLFGTTDHAARVRLSHIRVEPGARLRNFTSLAIDRHSGAPADGALFTSETFIGTALKFRLSLQAEQSLSKGDDVLFAALIDEVQQDGLELGGGAAKGFGWFVPRSGKGVAA